eukprot:GEMP01135054.1.p1 GENE.GEMP01135054.1~~GEMP01135054.1.p1  ORF type:complete len:123 (+),score=5.90 GEMP01135054.1:92-460(+)
MKILRGNTLTKLRRDSKTTVNSGFSWFTIEISTFVNDRIPCLKRFIPRPPPHHHGFMRLFRAKCTAPRTRELLENSVAASRNNNNNKIFGCAPTTKLNMNMHKHATSKSSIRWGAITFLGFR